VKFINESCNAVNFAKVESEVTKILTKMNDSSLNDISQTLYEKFSEQYADTFHWLFFVTKNFPRPNDPAAGWEGYDPNYQGKVIVSPWTVFWSARPREPERFSEEPPNITISPNIIKQSLYNVDFVNTPNAYQVRSIYDKLWAAINAANLARLPKTVWVFVNAWDSTIGNPLVGPNLFFQKATFWLRYQPDFSVPKKNILCEAYYIIQ